MQHDAGTLRTDDGLTLATRRWMPHDSPAAAVVIVHGLGDHSGRFAHVAAHLMLHDASVYALDLRGHGRSEGEPRAYAESFDDYVGDLALFLRHVREDAAQPLFVLGHSLGGLLAARYVTAHGTGRLAGLVLSSAALQLPSDLAPLLRKAAGLLSRLAPTLPTRRIPTAYLSQDPGVVRGYEQDPLVETGGVRARVGHEMLQTIRLVREHAGAFTLPLYLFHGTADRITDPAGSRWLYEHAPSEDKTLRLYDGFYHETMNEPDRGRVLTDLTDWLSERV